MGTRREYHELSVRLPCGSAGVPGVLFDWAFMSGWFGWEAGSCSNALAVLVRETVDKLGDVTVHSTSGLTSQPMGATSEP